MKKPINYNINKWCKSCGICADFCPANALHWEKGEKPVHDINKCVACKLCFLLCPDFAIEMEVSNHEG